MKLNLLIVSFLFASCATSKNFEDKSVEVTQVDWRREIASEPTMTPGQKLKFYMCYLTNYRRSKVIDKNECKMVSDINIGLVLSGKRVKEKDTLYTISSIEKVSVKVGDAKNSDWIECDGDDEACQSKGMAWDWFVITHFRLNDTQMSELRQKLQAAYSHNTGVSLYFSYGQMKSLKMGDQDKHTFYDLKDAELVIEMN